MRLRGGVWHARMWIDGKRVSRTTHIRDLAAATALAIQMQHDLVRSATRQVIYVLKPETGDRVKIGRTTNLPKRMRQIRANSPVRLELVAVIPGDHVFERELHRRFELCRVSGEWFRMSPELLAFIEAARWGEFVERKRPSVAHVERGAR